MAKRDPLKMQQPTAPLVEVERALRDRLDAFFPGGYSLALDGKEVPVFHFEANGFKCTALAAMSLAAVEGTARSIAKLAEITRQIEAGLLTPAQVLGQG